MLNDETLLSNITHPIRNENLTIHLSKPRKTTRKEKKRNEKRAGASKKKKQKKKKTSARAKAKANVKAVMEG